MFVVNGEAAHNKHSKTLKAKTEESKPSGSDRETGAQIETPVRKKMAEVPSRAARGKAPYRGW